MKEDGNAAKAHVEAAFESTFRLIFGECNVAMEDIAPYLTRGHYQAVQGRKSAISGREVAVSTSRYPANARYISQDEIDYAKKPPALSVNEIKDIDSIILAFGERFAYAGNKSFGNSAYSEGSDNCTDSFYVYRSHTVINSKYVGYSSFVRDGSECAFGSGVFLNGRHVIRFLGGHNVSRIFESHVILNCSDMFFCLYCLGCSDCMFSFNQRNRRHCIGNAELPRDRYAALRKKLVEESREYIEKHKSFYSIFDFPPPTKGEIAAIRVPMQPRAEPDLAPMESEFASATKLILGVPLSPLKKYEKFLTGRVEGIKKAKSPFGNDVFHSRYFWAANVPKERMITSVEGLEAARARISDAALEDATLAKLHKAASAIAFYPVQFQEGNNRNNAECPVMYHSTDCYRVSDATYSKKCAYCIHTTGCEAVFGSGILMTDSSFSLRCHDCVKVSMCMDMDACKNCFRSMFCHNCEGLTDSMFCFNAKNLKYAVGNVEVGREEYMRIRQKVVAELLARLERTGDIGIDICSIGAKE